MDLTVTEKEEVARGVVRVRLFPPEGTDLSPAPVGGHLPIVLPEGTARRYSLTSPLGASYREIMVLRADPSGGGSIYIHDRLAVGDTVVADPPEDGFPLADGPHHGVFVAGGIGITPFLTMIPALRAAGGTHELHYAVREADRRLPLAEEFACHPYADDGSALSLDIGALLDGVDRDAHLYVCGPRGLIEAVRIGAAERGHPTPHMHFESFGAAARPGDRPVTVRLAHSGSIIVAEPGTTILDAMLADGVWAPYQCRRGTCGQCWAPVAEGTPEHRDLCLTPEQRENGICTCVSWASTDELVLEL